MFNDKMRLKFNRLLGLLIQMQLDLKGQVIILDEAHNIEDICREVASVSFREDHLQAVINEFETLVKERNDESNTYKFLCLFVFKVLKCLCSVGLDKNVSRLILRNHFSLIEIVKYFFFKLCNYA